MILLTRRQRPHQHQVRRAERRIFRGSLARRVWFLSCPGDWPHV